MASHIAPCIIISHWGRAGPSLFKYFSPKQPNTKNMTITFIYNLVTSESNKTWTDLLNQLIMRLFVEQPLALPGSAKYRQNKLFFENIQLLLTCYLLIKKNSDLWPPSPTKEIWKALYLGNLFIYQTRGVLPGPSRISDSPVSAKNLIYEALYFLWEIWWCFFYCLPGGTGK